MPHRRSVRTPSKRFVRAIGEGVRKEADICLPLGTAGLPPAGRLRADDDYGGSTGKKRPATGGHSIRAFADPAFGSSTSSSWRARSRRKPSNLRARKQGADGSDEGAGPGFDAVGAASPVPWVMLSAGLLRSPPRSSGCCGMPIAPPAHRATSPDLGILGSRAAQAYPDKDAPWPPGARGDERSYMDRLKALTGQAARGRGSDHLRASAATSARPSAGPGPASTLRTGRGRRSGSPREIDGRTGLPRVALVPARPPTFTTCPYAEEAAWAYGATPCWDAMEVELVARGHCCSADCRPGGRLPGADRGVRPDLLMILQAHPTSTPTMTARAGRGVGRTDPALGPSRSRGPAGRTAAQTGLCGVNLGAHALGGTGRPSPLGAPGRRTTRLAHSRDRAMVARGVVGEGRRTTPALRPSRGRRPDPAGLPSGRGRLGLTGTLRRRGPAPRRVPTTSARSGTRWPG